MILRRVLSHLTIPIWSLFIAAFSVAGDGPVSFDSAKHQLVDVYRHNPVTLYCGCEVIFNRDVGGHPRNSGGRIVPDSCGYEVHSNPVRGERSEWEHIQSMSRVTEHFPFCSSRTECQESPIYRAIEGNAHNITLSVGEINGVRSSYRLVESLGDVAVSHDHGTFGACDFRADTARRLAEPPEETRGFIARTKLYMADRYAIPMPLEEQALMVRWHEAYPPDRWERERNAMLARIQGHANPFTTGERVWRVGDRPQGAGYARLVARYGDPIRSVTISEPESVVIRGNRNSRVFHRPDCPSYNAMAPHNIVEFNSVEAALEAGFRQAGNCPR